MWLEDRLLIVMASVLASCPFLLGVRGAGCAGCPGAYRLRSRQGGPPSVLWGAHPADGQSCLVGGLAEQDGVGVANRARPVGGDLQALVPPLHGEERSSSGN